MKTAIEIIEEVCKHYNSDNRCVDPTSGEAENYMSDTCMDPLARACLDPAKLKDVKGSASQVLQKMGWGILKDNYRITIYAFWDALQELHDDNSCWTTTGLSGTGEKTKDNLLNEYNYELKD